MIYPSLLRFMTITYEKATSLLKVSGAVGILQVRQLQYSLQRHLADGLEVNLDLGDLATCDTSAIQVFFSAQKTAAAAGIPLHFVSVSDAVMDLLATLGLAFDFPYKEVGMSL